MKRTILKVAIIIAVCLGIGFAIIVGISTYNNYYGVWYTGELTNRLSYITYNNGDYAIVDSSGTVIGERFDAIMYAEGGCLSLVFRKNDKKGFLSSENGSPIFNAQFDHAWVDNPRFGLAAYVKNNRLGFVNVKTGTFAIPPVFVIEKYHIAYHNFVFKDNGYCIVPGEDDKFGVIDTTGQIIIPAIYDEIDFISRGFMKLQSGFKYALYDSLFNIVLPMGYEKIEVNDFGIVALINHNQQLLDYNGKDVINNYWLDPIDYYEYITYFYEPFQGSGNEEMQISEYMKFRSGDKYGVFNAAYKVIVPPIYSDIIYNGNGYFACAPDWHGGAIIIDKNGKPVHGK